MLSRKIINDHHKYKKYRDYVGRTLNQFVKKDGEIIGCVGVGSAVLALTPRDDFIGWEKTQRLKNLNKSIQSLLKQTRKPDKIFINIPIKYNRFKETVDSNQIPKFDSSIVEITRCEDCGPGTKLDRKSVVQGKSVDLGGRRIIKKKKKKNNQQL